jgi:hypothetical protein
LSIVLTLHRTRFRSVAGIDFWRGLLVATVLTAVIVVTIQRGVFPGTHTNFAVFRQSFPHLRAGTNLYAAYPLEQGGAADRLFKYSPTAALLFAPLIVPPYAVALFFWNLANAALFLLAIDRLLPRREATIAMALVCPELLKALQSSSSNGLVAGLMMLAFLAAERQRQLSATLSIALGTLIKLFPIAGVTFALFQPRRRRFAIMLGLVFVVLVALPLVVTPAHTLIGQYGYWHAIESVDAVDLSFGDSLMRVLRDASGGRWPSWPVQVAGTALLLMPVALRREAWTAADFRLRFLCSLLVYVVLFNHQAENASFAIAGAGLVIWYVTSPRTMMRTAFLVACLAGLKTIPYAAVWLTMQYDLLTMRSRVASTVLATDGAAA